MKNPKNYIAWLVFVIICNPLYGQHQTKRSTVKATTAEVTSQAMISDLNAKFPDTKGSKIFWEPGPYGYKAVYTLSNLDYMTWYDKDGNYLETLLKTDWDDRVPAILKMELDGSDFNTCTVLKYWVSVNTRNDSYFLELTDRDGKSQNVWADENGKLSKIPVFVR